MGGAKRAKSEAGQDERYARVAAAFGAALVLQPQVARAAEDAPDQRHHSATDAALRLGEEVLIDCLLLSRCDALLHVTSNIATTAGYINPRLKMLYCEGAWEAWQGWRWARGHRRRISGTLFQP